MQTAFNSAQIALTEALGNVQDSIYEVLGWNVDVALATYNSLEVAKRESEDRYLQVAHDYGAPTSRATAMAISQAKGMKRTPADIARAAYVAYEDFPGIAYKKYGGGGGVPEAYHTMTKLCQLGCFDADLSAQLAATKLYGECKPNPSYGGAVTKIGKLKYLKNGIQLGESSQQGIMCRRLVQCYGKTVDVQVRAHNVRSVQDMLALQARDLEKKNYTARGNDGQFTPAIYTPGKAVMNKDLFLRVVTETPQEQTLNSMLAVLSASACGADMDRDLAALTPYISPPTTDDSARFLKASLRRMSGDECYSAGFEPSPKCKAKMAAAGQADVMQALTTGTQTEGQMIENVIAAQGNMQESLDRTEDGDTGVGAETVAKAYDTLVTVLVSPQYRAFASMIDEKYAREAIADAQQSLNKARNQIALNLQQLYYEDNRVLAFRDDDPRLEKAPTQLALADVFEETGVDTASLMPVNGGQKFPAYAALMPSLMDQIRDTSGLTLIAQGAPGDAAHESGSVASMTHLVSFTKEAMKDAGKAAVQ